MARARTLRYVLCCSLLVPGLGTATDSRARAPLDRRAPVLETRPPAVPDKLEQGLEARLRAATEADRFTVLVDLSRQIDYRKLARRVLRDSRPRREAQAAVIRLFEQVADAQQAPLLPELDAWIDDGRLDWVAPVAVVNRLIVEGSAPGILALAERPEVARVLADWHSRRARGNRAAGGASAALGERFANWALAEMGARRLWEQGLDGRGVVVAGIDTGAREDHEQLAGRRLPGRRGWFDPVQGRDQPYDSHGHGTGVLSLAVGGNPGGREVGVAPGAQWAMGLANFRNFYSRSRMTLAADWVLRVARPDVVVNAWSHDEGPCTRFDLPFINAWRAAGIFVVFPAGNKGPGPGSGESPAQLAGAFPDDRPVFSVAAVTPGGDLHRLSSRGPSECGSTGFPSLAAPGDALPHAASLDPGSYLTGAGTSLSAGLVGGAAALLLQADPELRPWELETILLETARDLPPEGHDTGSGAGMLDLPAALDEVRRRAARRR
jgi:bacillopeptidase F